MTALSNRLPHVKGAYAVASTLWHLYQRKARLPVATEVHGFRVVLDPHELIDVCLLFIPQFYDREEFDFLRTSLRPGQVFVDVGANIGIYSLIASRQVGPTGRVLAIEASPATLKRLEHHLKVNEAGNVVTVPMGVSDREETLTLSLQTAGNKGGNTFLAQPGDNYHDSVEVACRPLLAIFLANGIDKVDFLKIDIEGFEHRVLSRFFEDAPEHLWPVQILVEFNAGWQGEGAGDLMGLLRERGYEIIQSTPMNYILRRAIRA